MWQQTRDSLTFLDKKFNMAGERSQYQPFIKAEHLLGSKVYHRSALPGVSDLFISLRSDAVHVHSDG